RRRDIDHVGHRRGRHHRRRRAGPGRSRIPLRPAVTAMAETVIKAAGLTKRYGRTTVVDGVDLTVEQGEVVGLLGPNGAGKTTTILMLLGLTEPSAGSVSILGLDPLREPLAVKRQVGYLPDAVGFYDGLTGRENLRYTARLGELPAAVADQ